MAMEKKMITLRSCDGEVFEVEEEVAMESQTIKHMIEDDCADSGIPVPNVNSKILAKVIEYCKKHVDSAKPKSGEDTKASAAAASAADDGEIKAWDAEFVKVDQATLFDLILGCNRAKSSRIELHTFKLRLFRSSCYRAELELTFRG